MYCYLCYKTFKNCKDNDNEKESERFIKFIFRHLNNQNSIDKIEQNLLTEAFKLSQNPTGTPVSRVQVCISCKLITNNFCEFYQKIKEIELRLDFEITKVWDTMGCSDKFSLKVEELDKEALGQTTDMMQF